MTDDLAREATASELAAGVRSGALDPVDVVTAALARIEGADRSLGALVSRRDTAALEDARTVAGRPDRDRLPLAGVPVVIKDVEDVAGLPTRHGSTATDDTPRGEDGPMVRRLTEAGAVVVGKTRLPELAIWPMSDDATGVARNPWDPSRSSGGSSGGTATAVAAGMAPIGLGSDGMGSIRIPAACCGLVGIKPGRGTTPVLDERGEVHWFGMSRFGPLATTVADAALMLDVLAGTDRYRDPSPPDRPLRIAVSVTTPAPVAPVDRHWRDAVVATARTLHRAGHRVVGASPPYAFRDVLAAVTRWAQGPGVDVDRLGLDPGELQGRTRSHLAFGSTMARAFPVRDDDAAAWRERALGFFADVDVLVTPTLAAFPVAATDWRDRAWAANVAAALPLGTFTGAWNLADLAAVTVPAGVAPNGLPVAVQLVAPDGHEELVLAVAAQLEELAPWVRHPPAG